MPVSSVWDERYMSLAAFIGTWSKDQSRKVGCVISGPSYEVRSIGYNGFPRGIREAPRSRRLPPDKYFWTEHAERNAIYLAARSGTPLYGCTLYVPWFPCTDCARAILQVGIARLVAIRPKGMDPQWDLQFRYARAMLNEARIPITWWNLTANRARRRQ